MQVGRNPSNGRTAEHAFAITNRNGNEYRSKRLGSVRDCDRRYPAEVYEPRNVAASTDAPISWGQKALSGALGDAAENIDCTIIDVEFMLEDYRPR